MKYLLHFRKDLLEGIIKDGGCIELVPKMCPRSNSLPPPLPPPTFQTKNDEKKDNGSQEKGKRLSISLINPFRTRKSSIFLAMIWGTFVREGTLFLENANRINLSTEQQSHLPQALCHIIGIWRLIYKLGMVKMNQTHKLHKLFCEQ